MAEEVKEKEKAEEEEGDRPMSAIEKAEMLTQKMNEQNERMERNIAMLQEMRATDMLSGSADAGQGMAQKKEMSDEEYANQVMAGETPNVPKL